MRSRPIFAAIPLAVLVCACAPAKHPQRVRPPALTPEVEAAAPVPTLSPAKVGEEALLEEPTPAPERAVEELVAAPSPPTILASITSTTPPQAATSLRLTEEGRQLLLRGDLHGALARLEKAIKIDPNNAHGYYWMAQVHYRSQRYDQAIAFADKATVLFARSDRDWVSQTYTFKGEIYEQIGRYPEARTAYRRAVDAQAGNIAARAGLARLGDGQREVAP